MARMNGTLHYVFGGTDTEDREQVREIVENSKNQIMSYWHHTELSLQVLILKEDR